ncbi:homocitrate synthase [Paenibacillus sp. 7124]|uniref:Homocitrate synthase n=1 Tax=Paenibacillus apii TaxID=1850370 RepID=A0A6M1PME7_9BACL|nr:homocitrate synthase [Paenibacillus apii]NGM83502.1 homocitrate synthase [Paenibacillus apii]
MPSGVQFELVDTTLRDGDRAGAAFSLEEKLRIATALNRAGIRWIEVGVPALREREGETLRQLMSLSPGSALIAWSRAEPEEIGSAISCGFSHIHISLPVSDVYIGQKLRRSREWVLRRLFQALEYAQSRGCTVFVGADDASRADPDFLLHYAEMAASFGAARLRYADTTGCLDPFETYRHIRYLTDRCALPVEFQGHNDYGLAAANTLSAFHGGAAFASVTVSGIGERAGNASIEEVASSMAYLYKLGTGVRMDALSELNQLVSAAGGRPGHHYRSVFTAING